MFEVLIFIGQVPVPLPPIGVGPVTPPAFLHSARATRSTSWRATAVEAAIPHRDIRCGQEHSARRQSPPAAFLMRRAAATCAGASSSTAASAGTSAGWFSATSRILSFEVFAGLLSPPSAVLDRPIESTRATLAAGRNPPLPSQNATIVAYQRLGTDIRREKCSASPKRSRSACKTSAPQRDRCAGWPGEPSHSAGSPGDRRHTHLGTAQNARKSRSPQPAPNHARQTCRYLIQGHARC